MPDHFLVLLETSVEQIDLRGETVGFGVAIEICQIFVVFNGFVVGGQFEMLCQLRAKSGFPCANHTGNTDKGILKVLNDSHSFSC